MLTGSSKRYSTLALAILPTLILKSGNFNRVFCNWQPTPSTTSIEQQIDLFLNGPAYTTFLHVGITARPVTSLASLLLNRPQGDNYARKRRASPLRRANLVTISSAPCDQDYFTMTCLMTCFHEQKIQQALKDLRTKKFALVSV
jgi:hypothetical protein